MTRLTEQKRFLIVFIIALFAAFVSVHPFANANAYVVLPWGLLAILSAYIARSKKEALLLGGCFGFVVSYSYLWFDDTSKLSLSKIVFLIFLIILPALFGILCGITAAYFGWKLRKRFCNR